VQGFPPELEAVIVRALEVDTERRYPTAAALVEDLQRFAASAGLDVEAPARAGVLVHRFGFEPPPVVDLGAILPRSGGMAKRAPASPLRWVALAGVGAAIGAVGFLVGGLVREGGATTPVTEGAPVPAVVGAPEGAGTALAGAPPGPGASVESTPGAAASAAAAEVALDDGPGEGDEPAGAEGLIEGATETGAFEGETDDLALDDPDDPSPDRRSRSRRRGKTKPDADDPAKGDPDSLLPPSWRNPR
jgi:hypothetical protein